MRQWIDLIEMLTESAMAPLYHGYNDIANAVMALKNNEMLATTPQRFWAKGARYPDNHPEYRKSFWMKGISTTRDLRYAMGWGNVVFVLDQAKIKMKYKIMPLHWGNSPRSHIKREKEEFIIRKDTYDQYIKPLEDGEWVDPNRENIDFTRFKAPEGSIKPLRSFLKGIYLEQTYKKYNSENIKMITDHPLFIGFYDVIKDSK